MIFDLYSGSRAEVYALLAWMIFFAARVPRGVVTVQGWVDNEGLGAMEWTGVVVWRLTPWEMARERRCRISL